MSEHTTLSLDGEVTIYRAAEIQSFLSAALSDSQGGLEIDLGAVTEIDSAGVQLLIATKRAAQAAGVSLTLRGHSDSVVDVFEALNLVSFFGDPLVIAARKKSEGHAK